MSQVAVPYGPITLDDLARMAETDESHRYELSAEGVLTVMPPGDYEHGVVISRLLAWFFAYGYPPERVVSNAGVKVGRGTGGRQPDVVLLARTLDGGVYLDPREVLLAVEVESPGSLDIDRTTKPREYAEAGIPDFWRVTRRDGSAMVSLHRRGDADKYECWRVLPLDELLADDPVKLLSGADRS